MTYSSLFILQMFSSGASLVYGCNKPHNMVLKSHAFSYMNKNESVNKSFFFHNPIKLAPTSPEYS